MKSPQRAGPGDETCWAYPELKACNHYEREGRKTCQECLDWTDPEMEVQG